MTTTNQPLVTLLLGGVQGFAQQWIEDLAEQGGSEAMLNMARNNLEATKQLIDAGLQEEARSYLRFAFMWCSRAEAKEHPDWSNAL